MPVSDLTVTVEADGDEDAIEIPAGLLDRLMEEGETRADVVGSITLMALTGRAHALLHHTEDTSGEELEDIEAVMQDRFEDRFGMTYAEATGHSH
ncbi:MAG: hypothetical protein ABEH88_12010 [Halobacteriales archaeon]